MEEASGAGTGGAGGGGGGDGAGGGEGGGCGAGSCCGWLLMLTADSGAVTPAAASCAARLGSDEGAVLVGLREA